MGEAILFGYTESEFAELATGIGFPALILFMLFIIGQLAYSSKVGRLGTFVLFFVLAFGMLGFVAKFVIQAIWDL